MRKAADMRIFFTIFTALTVSGFIVICTLGQTVHRQRVEAKLNRVYPSSLPEVPQYLTVREYDGRVCVFIGESESPYRTVDVDISLLSDFDRTQLREGIVFESEEELRQYIEDISS